MTLSLRLISLILALGFALSACGPEPRRQPPPNGEAVRQPAQREAARSDGVVAKVNGTEIRFSDVAREAEAQGALDADAPFAQGDTVFERVLEELIDQRLLAMEARRRSLHQGDEARRRLAIAEERILGNVLVETAIAQAVTDEAVQRVYEEQSALVTPGEEVRARHILVDTREQADEVKRLLDEGEDFVQLAIRVSQDQATRLDGGDLGFFTRRSILPAFGEIAFETSVGEVSEPFESEFGWHVLRVEARRREPRPTLEDMRASIVRFLTFSRIEELVTELRGGAVIQRFGEPSRSLRRDPLTIPEDLDTDSGEDEAAGGPEADEAGDDAEPGGDE